MFKRHGIFWVFCESVLGQDTAEPELRTGKTQKYRNICCATFCTLTVTDPRHIRKY